MNAEYTPDELVRLIEEYFTIDAEEAKKALENIKINSPVMYAETFKVEFVDEKNIIGLLQAIGGCFHKLRRDCELGGVKYDSCKKSEDLFKFDNLMFKKIADWYTPNFQNKHKYKQEILERIALLYRNIQDQNKGFDKSHAKKICKSLISFCLDPAMGPNKRLGEEECLIIKLFQMKFNFSLDNDDIIPNNLADDIKERARKSLKSKDGEDADGIGRFETNDITVTSEELAQVEFAKQIDHKLQEFMQSIGAFEASETKQEIYARLIEVRGRDPPVLCFEDASLFCSCLVYHCWGHGGTLRTGQEKGGSLERSIIKLLLHKFQHTLNFTSIIEHPLYNNVRAGILKWYNEESPRQGHQSASKAMMLDACAGMQCQNACWFDVQIHGLRAQICGHPREKQCLQVLELFRQYYNCQMQKFDNNDERQLFTLVWNSLSCVCETPVALHPVQCPQQIAYTVHPPTAYLSLAGVCRR